MPAENATAIVIRVVDFSETSCVVTLFTREFGKLGAMAKGARRPKGPFESALDLLALCRVVTIRKSSDTLDLLTEAKLERRFRPPGRDLSRLYAGYYLAELLHELTHESDAHPELFDAAAETLDRLCGSEPLAAVVLHFELTALRLLGHLPSWQRCVECGRQVPRQSRVPFGQLDGGVLCAECRPGKKHVVSLSAAALETLVQYSDVQWADLPVGESRITGEVRGVLNHYLSHLLGKQPRMHRYLGILAT